MIFVKSNRVRFLKKANLTRSKNKKSYAVSRKRLEFKVFCGCGGIGRRARLRTVEASRTAQTRINKGFFTYYKSLNA